MDDRGPPTSLVNNGTLLSKPTEIADCLNDYFIDKIINLKRNIPPRTSNPVQVLKNAMQNWEGRHL